MANQRRGIALTPMETRRKVIVEMAILADQLGYELFSVPEGWGFDSTLVLTEIALKTKQITVMSGILSVWGRTAGTIAMNAATWRISAAAVMWLAWERARRRWWRAFTAFPSTSPPANSARPCAPSAKFWMESGHRSQTIWYPAR